MNDVMDIFDMLTSHLTVLCCEVFGVLLQKNITLFPPQMLTSFMKDSKILTSTWIMIR